MNFYPQTLNKNRLFSKLTPNLLKNKVLVDRIKDNKYFAVCTQYYFYNKKFKIENNKRAQI